MIQIKNGRSLGKNIYKRYERELSQEQIEKIIAANSLLSQYIENLELQKKMIMKDFNNKIKHAEGIFNFLTRLLYVKKYETGSEVNITEDENGQVSYADIETGEVVKVIDNPSEMQKKLFETQDQLATPIHIFPGLDHTIETPDKLDYNAIKEKHVNGKSLD